MKKCETLCTARNCHVDGVLHCAVPPAQLLGVFLCQVLSVMYDRARAAENFCGTRTGRVHHSAGQIAAFPAARPPQGFGIWLVVSGIDKRSAARLDPITETGRGVVQVLC